MFTVPDKLKLLTYLQFISWFLAALIISYQHDLCVPPLNINPSSTYIRILSHDLLWLVLDINADMHHESEGKLPALTTLRRVSQVSSFWREVALSASSLWGKIINLNQLNQKTCYWRNEVLRRSGKSPLCVQRMTGKKKANSYFFAIILNDHWGRKRRLDLDPWGEIDYIGHQVAIDLFSQPAPFLEKFNVPTFYHSGVIGEGYRSFSDKAPCLRSFKHFITSGQMPSHLRAPWMPQLRSLFLTHRISARQLLNALSSTPLLEDLTARFQLTKDPNPTPLPVVMLPRLNRLYFDAAGAREWIDILSKLTPAVECSLRFVLTLDYSQSPLTAADISGAFSLLSDYFDRHFNTRENLSVGLHFMAHGFDLFDNETTPITRVESSETDLEAFDFLLALASTYPGSSLSSAFLGSICLHNWHKVETLDLLVENYLDYSNINFIKFLSSLTSLKLLVVRPRTLQLLLDSMFASPDVLLPCLRQLRYVPDKARPNSPVLGVFLTLRKRIGYPIDVLEITDFHVANRTFRYLDAILGLTVVWWFKGALKEYHCGSGTPEVLDFTHSKKYFNHEGRF
ncbi:hypothetical protein GALMADRAFT_280361 [Galerina marginata CBS 339.88]|uniref:F-box domain-containing protein n=1 Tax=Galerina marginata (strain CBS 339.88) TaxID=685588 RepID=A0A067T381_GALM3|nr:hypothetical protein GALMADRAFT_280361 [Galerina marginata CBS 339.88]